jgi:hypothetical protein
MNDDKINEVITNLRHCDAHYDHIEHDTFENAIGQSSNSSRSVTKHGVKCAI